MENPNIAQNESITIISALKKSWLLVHGLKWPVFSAYLAGVIAIILLNIIGFILSPNHLGAVLGGICTFLVGILSVYINWFVLSMLILLGARKAMAIEPNTLKQVFAISAQSKQRLLGLMAIYYLSVFVFVFLWVILTALADNGFSILLVAILSIVLLCASIYCLLPIPVFALPLMTTTQCSIFEAIQKSYSMFKRCWLRLIASLFLMLIILSISAIPFGIGLIWTIPMAYALNGIWFKEMSSL